MIHRFLLFDPDFNCRLDRFYPLNTTSTTTTATEKEKNNLSVSRTEVEEFVQGKGTKQYGNWQVLQLATEPEEPSTSTNTSAAGLSKELSALSLSSTTNAATAKQIEHSQKLLLGATHSLRNMLLKLSPLTRNPLAAAKAFVGETGQQGLVDGYGFWYGTSGYRVQYFESISGYRLILVVSSGTGSSAGNSGSTTTSSTSTVNAFTSAFTATATSSSTTTTSSSSTVPTPYGPVTPDSCLKVLYSELIVSYCMHYPLGRLKLPSDAPKKKDAFGRAGFLGRLDEYIGSVEKLF